MTMPTKLYDVLIVGKGPAGISAALYALRANLSVAIVAKDAGALSRAHLISNYYGLEAPVPGADLEKRGEAQAKALGAEFFDGEVLDLMFSDVFELKTKDAAFKAKTVIVAAGAVRSKAPVTGLDSYEGRGVSYCAVCDGFFYRKKPVAVLGNGAYALAEAKELCRSRLRSLSVRWGKIPLLKFHRNFPLKKKFWNRLKEMARWNSSNFQVVGQLP